MKVAVIDQQNYIKPAAMLIPEQQQQQVETSKSDSPAKILLKKPEDFTYSLSTLQPLHDTQDKQQKYTPINFESHTPSPLNLNKAGNGNNSVILIRHGTTVFNLISNKFTEQTGYTFKDREALFTFDQLLMDTQLHQSGKDQAQNLALQLKNNSDLKFHTVFVSPLRRTLQTCYYIFKDHPMRKQIKFVVLPLVCEIYSKVCDIGDSGNTFLDAELKEFFDFSQIKQTWQVEGLQDEELKQNLQNRLQYQNGKCMNLEEILTEFSDSHFPKNVESYDSVYKRGQMAKQFIKKYVEENEINDKEEKIVVISHNSYLRNFTANGPDNGKTGAGGLKFANCQAVEYNF